MTTLAHTPIDEPTADLLALVADDTALGKVHADDFHLACVADARAHDGYVSVSRVSALLHERFGEINSRWFSSMWTKAGAKKSGWLVKTEIDEPIDPTYSRGNSNKATKLRRFKAGA